MICSRSFNIFVSVLVLLIFVGHISGEPVCAELPVIKNGTLLLDGKQPPYEVNDVILYKCDDSFRTDEIMPTVTCVLRDDDVANWTESTCKPVVISCHDPGYIENAHRSGNMFTFPNSITYVCNDGYKLNGFATKYCSNSGQWQPPSMPYCEAVLCPGLIAPANGKVIQSNRRPDSVAEYTCEKYYKLVGDSKRKCQEDGTWNGSNPSCERITCPAPGKFPNGRIIGSIGSVHYASDILIFQCDDGTHRTSKCLENGEWSLRPPTCTGPTNIESTTVAATSTASGLEDQEKNPIKCDDPGPINNGDKTFTSFLINSTLTYTCDEGYQLKGKSTLLCLENGKWDLEKLPMCIKPLSVPAVIGIVFGVIILVFIVIGGYLLYRYKVKSIRGYGEKSKALTADATDIEEITGLEREKKHIPVTVL